MDEYKELSRNFLAYSLSLEDEFQSFPANE